MGLLIVFALLARSRLSRLEDATVPDQGMTIRNFGEVIVEQIANFVGSVMGGHGAADLVPFIGTMFLFILGCNLLGLIPGMEPPTADSNLTFALGAIAFVFYQWRGIRVQGLLQHLRGSFVGP